MKPRSIITIIKKTTGLSLFFILSIIAHSSIFIINPTFSFTVGSKWEEQKTGFLVVELKDRKDEDGKKTNLIQPGAIPRRDKTKVGIGSGAALSSGGTGRYKKTAIKKRMLQPKILKTEAPIQTQTKKDAVNKPAESLKDNVRDDSSHNAAIAPSPTMEPNKDAEAALPSPSEKEDLKPGQPLSIASSEQSPGPVKEPEVAKGDVAEAQPLTETVGEDAAEENLEEKVIEPLIQQTDEPVKTETSPAADSKEKEDLTSEQPTDRVKEPEVIKGDVIQAKPLTEAVREDAARENIEEKVIEPLIQDTNESLKPDTVPAADNNGTSPVQQEKTGEGLKPALVDAAPLESGIGAAKSASPTAETSPVKSAEVIEKVQVAEVKDEKAESPVKIIEPKVEARVKKKIRPTRLHKLLEPKKDPMRLGIPVNRPKVKITAPAKKRLSDRVQSIGGRVEGNGIIRVILSVNNDVTTIPVKDNHFQWDGVLKEGKNIISADVWDMDGYSATDRVTVEVLPVKNGFELSIDEPAGDGLESPVTTVNGRVGDRTVDTVRLILNGEFVEAAAEEGRFEKTVLLKERDNILEAEAVNSVGLSARSIPVKFTVKSLITSDIQIELLWNDMDVELTPAIVKKERAQIENDKAVWREIGVTELMSAAEGYRDKILAAGEVDAGAYELGISGGKGTECTLIVTINSSKRRVFEKMLLEGEVWIAGRFLMPEGVFWDEDEWFSGKIEGKDFMTKYKSPEGVTWKERKEGFDGN